jgi:hypothetical protein
VEFSPTSRKAVGLLALVFVLGIAFGTAGVLWAPRIVGLVRGAPATAPTDQPASRLARQLNLTPEQQQTYNGILRDTQAQYDAIRQEMDPQFRQVRQQSRERITQILTAQQRPLFDEFMQRSRNRRGSTTRMVARLTAELSLTSPQQTQLTAILQDTRARFEGLRQQMNPRFDEVRQRSRERIRALVSPQQRPILEDFYRRRDERRMQEEQRRREICWFAKPSSRATT